MTIISVAKSSDVDVYRVFKSVLEIRCCTTISPGLVTTIVPLTHVKPLEMIQVLKQGIEIARENLKYADNLMQKYAVSAKSFYRLDFLILFLIVYYML